MYVCTGWCRAYVRMYGAVGLMYVCTGVKGLMYMYGATGLLYGAVGLEYVRGGVGLMYVCTGQMYVNKMQ